MLSQTVTRSALMAVLRMPARFCESDAGGVLAVGDSRSAVCSRFPSAVDREGEDERGPVAVAHASDAELGDVLDRVATQGQ